MRRFNVDFFFWYADVVLVTLCLLVLGRLKETCKGNSNLFTTLFTGSEQHEVLGVFRNEYFRLITK